MPGHQYSLALIERPIKDSIVQQRASDGYINATAMCKAAGKEFAHYKENASTQAFWKALSTDLGIPISEAIQQVRGGTPELQGTWVHPQAAIHLGQWLSPQFAVQVSKWVYDWMTGKVQPAKLPYHLERHLLNHHKIPNDHFSILQEMTNALVAPMEARGYRLPEHMMPDIAHGRMLCKMLRERHGVDTNALPMYEHEFPDGRVVDAKLYPIQYLGDFRVMIATIWMPQKAAAYFKERDPVALPVLDAILRLGNDVARLPSASNKSRFRRSA